MPTQLGQVLLQSILYLKNKSGRKFAKKKAIWSLSRRRPFGSSRNPRDEALRMSQVICDVTAGAWGKKF